MKAKRDNRRIGELRDRLTEVSAEGSWRSAAASSETWRRWLRRQRRAANPMTLEDEFPQHVMPNFGFYREVYGGTFDAESFAAAKPAAERCVCRTCLSAAVPEDMVDEEERLAWCLAVCAAAEVFGAYGVTDGDAEELAGSVVDQVMRA